MKLILASGSPRRAEILRNAGISFEVRAAHVDESRRVEETSGDYVRRVALAKARAVAAQVSLEGRSGRAIIIGADTVVVVENGILGKPTSSKNAREMLLRLSGRTHEVRTGLALLRLPDLAERIAEEITQVEFAPLSEEEIDDYIASGEPNDKAGAYAIQGRGGRFVTRVDGCYFNVMGLPLSRLYALLREWDWKPR